MTGYMEPDRADNEQSGVGQGLGPARDIGLVDDMFKADVETALWRYGIQGFQAMSLDQKDQLILKLWNNPYLAGLYGQVAGSSDSNLALTESNLTSEIEKTLFNPTQSSDPSLVAQGMQLRQASGLPLTSEEKSFMLGNSGSVPAPFDQSALSGYGYQFGAPTSYGHHEGVDYDVPQGTPIYASFDGTIETSSSSGGYGNKLVLHLANGYSMVFGHLSGFRAVSGQQVHAGEMLGLSGSTGDSTGPHIHLEWRDPSGQALDPTQMVQHIWSGTTYSQLGMSGMGSGVSAADAQDRLLGRDPILAAKYPDVVGTWKKYFGQEPTGQQIQSIVGGAGVGPAAAGAASGGAQLADLLRQAGFPEQVIPTMVAIGMAESGGRADAVGDKAIGGSIGIWQIYTKAHPGLVQKYNLADPLQNAKAAKEVFDSQGLNAWSTYKNGAFKAHLGQGGAVSGAGLDSGQIEDRIRGLPSHIPGIGVGQYTDLRSSLNSQANKLFGHDVTDGMIQEAYQGGYTSQTGVNFYLMQMDLGGKIPAHVYSSIVSAAQPHMRGLYNQSGFDPRIAAKLVQTHSQPGQWIGPPPDSGQQQDPHHYMEPDRGDN